MYTVVVRTLLVHVNEMGMRVRHFRAFIHTVSRFAQGQKAQGYIPQKWATSPRVRKDRRGYTKIH